MKKNISKVTLLTCLLVGSIVNAETFYQCVPNKEFIQNVIKEKEEKKWIFVKDIKLEENLNLISIYVNLSYGNYKVVTDNYISIFSDEYNVIQTKSKSNSYAIMKPIKKSYNAATSYIKKMLIISINKNLAHFYSDFILDEGGEMKENDERNFFTSKVPATISIYKEDTRYYFKN